MGFSLFKEKREPQNEATPSLGEVFRQAQDSFGSNIKVSMPAKVIKYDLKKQTVDVRPVFKNKDKTGKTTQSAIIYNVPVAFPRANSSIIAMPVKKGDNVNLIFSDKSIEKFQSDDSEHDPEDNRSHHISDAVAYVGLYPNTKPLPLNNSDDIIIKNANDNKDSTRLEMRIKENGKIQILNQTNELISVLDEMLSTLRAAKVYTSTGAQLLRHGNFENVQSKLRTFLSG